MPLRPSAALALLLIAASAAGQTPDRVETGRRLFAAHCARCHGGDAAGTADAPSLLVRVRTMSEPAFSGAVLYRYRFSLPSSEAGGESARDALRLGQVRPRTQRSAMPLWEADPAVRSGIESLYLYLSDAAKKASPP